jgi:membrane protein DedA with SNARE-associated domain
MIEQNEWITQYGYLAVMAGPLIEGDGLAILAGVAARHGYLNIFLTILMTAIGAMISDQFLFFLGRRYGDPVLKKFHRHQHRIERARQLIQRYPSLWVIGTRFAYGFRTIGPIIIGTSGIPIKRFIALNIVGAFLWASIMVGIGYGVGDFLQRLFATQPHAGIWLAALVAALVAAALTVRVVLRRRRQA